MVVVALVVVVVVFVLGDVSCVCGNAAYVEIQLSGTSELAPKQR